MQIKSTVMQFRRENAEFAGHKFMGRKSGKSGKRKCEVYIAQNAINIIIGESNKACDTETGGIIAGTGSVESGKVVITHASGPGPKAIQGRFNFSRDTAFCQDTLNKWVLESQGEVDYLGEWHKHLEPKPALSSLDCDTLVNIAISPKYYVNQPLMLIIGKPCRVSSLRLFSMSGEKGIIEIKWSPVEKRAPDRKS